MESTQQPVDVLVIGSGGGGFGAAIRAAKAGLKVLVVEKGPYIGGTTALSGGYMWMPLNRLTMPHPEHDSREQAELYLHSLAGDAARSDMIKAFLDNSPRLFEFLEKETEVKFLYGDHYVDYNSELPGAGKNSRTIGPIAYDGRNLGKDIHMLPPPHEALKVLGKDMMADKQEIGYFITCTRSLKSLGWTILRVSQYFRDRLLYGKGMRLAFGRALVGRLLKTARDLGIEFWTNSPAKRLIREDGRITGVEVERDGRRVVVPVRHGVVMASGGFAHDPELKRKYLPYPDQHRSATMTTNQGDGARMGTEIGADFQPAAFNNYAGCAMSFAQHPDGTETQGLHSHSLGYPGCITVNTEGKRFANEALSYNFFMRAMCEAGAVPAWVIADHAHLRQWGFGQVKPGVRWLPQFKGKFLRSGYLKRARSIGELAEQIGVPRANLEATVARFNDMAKAGKDEDFHRGETRYDNMALPPSKWPCRGLAPIEQGPFYAFKLEPGNLGTYAGLVTDASARVLDAEGKPIPGLYAAGLDMLSFSNGHYPGGGGSVGPAMTFGYIAAGDIISRATNAG